jgi:hypothetical protein
MRSAMSGADPIARIARLLDVDAPLAADDIAALLVAFRRAAASGETIESALGLAPGWRKVIAARRRDAALAALPWAGSKRAQAAQTRRALLRYANTKYPADRDRGAAGDPEDAPLYALLAAHGGKILSEESFRRLASAGPWVKIADAITHATSDDGGMAKSKTPVLDPAQMSPEQLDEHIADIRLPQLLRERAELTRRLADLFASIGYECDWNWAPNDAANEVALLLTGHPAPAEQAMPAAALHAHLIRRQQALDKAIAAAQRAAARVAERRLDARIEAHRPQINALARERCLLALELQRANRRLFEMEARLGVDPRFGLPSSGAALLGAGLPGDEVAVLTDALLVAGIISRKDLVGAQ